MERISIIRLGCVGCGASLEIGGEVKQLACVHCGTSQIVERTGGSIHLKEFAQTLSRVQAGTDKTAAELALARLDKERNELLARRGHLEIDYGNRRDQKIIFWKETLEVKRNSINLVMVISGLVTFVVFASLARGQTIGILISILFAVAVPIGLRFLMMRSETYNLPMFEDLRAKQLRDIDTEFHRGQSSITAHISGIDVQIKRQRDIANS